MRSLDDNTPFAAKAKNQPRHHDEREEFGRANSRSVFQNRSPELRKGAHHRAAPRNREDEFRDEGQQHVAVSQTSQLGSAMPPAHGGIHLLLLVCASAPATTTGQIRRASDHDESGQTEIHFRRRDSN
jgi:hypothetical protein